VVRRDQPFGGPTLFDDLHQLVGDVQAPAVVPAVLEPPAQLLRRVGLEHIHVQLALLRQPGQRQVAAAQIADDRVDGIAAVEQIKLGV